VTDPLIAAARFLTAQLPWLRHATDEQGAPVAADVFREIGDCAARMRSLVDGPREQKYLGPCGAVHTDGWAGEDANGIAVTVEERTCFGDVYGVAGAQNGRCRTCGATVDQDARRQWLDDEVRARAFRASEIEDAYGISANLIRQWATPERGLLRIHDHDVQGRARYLLSDVLDLAARQAAKRLERQADRERRATRRTAEMGA
jgi:hypothetical protein